MIKHVISVSGGKDSTATLLLALDRCDRENVIPIFCDTGNEHEAVYEYLGYLEQALDIKITRLKADFSEQIAAKRMFIARDSRTKRIYKRVPKIDRNGNPVYKKDADGNVILFPIYGEDADGEKLNEVIGYAPIQIMGWDNGKKVRWSNKAKRRALSVLHTTGNPFLDLCLWKGRFPSRKAQFCTEELKRNMAVAYQLEISDQGYQVISWQGIRRDESLNRRNAKKFERIGPNLWAFRPIVDWTAMQVFDYCAGWAIQPNPLYKQGMGRVGCMPCINVNKAELGEISRRFPDHLARISKWEKLVAMASKREAATFIPAPGITPDQAKDHGIYSVVEWAKTTRGGRQYDLLAGIDEPSACASAYGLCE
jgi:3'-phosphoadenosine 5'-phosphosulfate sulfotransferase (PAPS reductase)/FAD synthetase